MSAAERAGARAVQEAKARIAAAAAEVSGVRAEVTDKGVAISGRGLVRRVLTDARLHAIGSMGR